MNLTDQINQQYNKRKNKEHLYHNGYYVDNVRSEFYKCIHDQLKKYFTEFTELTLLEIGAGTGSNAYIFEKLGFSLSNIHFNELLPERIEAIKCIFPDNILYEGDALNVSINKQFDVVFQSTVFSSVLNQVDRISLASKMWSLLKPGGVVLWYDFIYNNPKNKDVRKINENELKELFNDCTKFEVKKITLAPPIGRLVGRFYKLFNLPMLRSHILVVIKKDEI